MTVPFEMAQSMLTNQIREKLDKKIKKLINCFNLSQIEIRIPSDNLDLSDFQYVKVAEQKKVWEEIAKLSINFIVDYEYNRQFTFENRYDTDEYKKRLEILGFVYEKSRWKSVRKPEFKDVQTNMFMYFLYRLIKDKMTLNAVNDQNNENERRHLGLNFDTEISDNDRKIDLLSIDGDGWNNVARDNHNMPVMFSDTDDDRTLLDDGNGGCDSTKKDINTHIPEDEWKCGTCCVRQSYRYTVCDMCSSRRSIHGWWMCGKCTCINKCDKESCDACGEWNKYCPTTYCQYCKKNRVPMTEVRCDECAKNKKFRWRCQYRSCNTGNNDAAEYCGKCNLWRHNSQNRGAESKQLYLGKERNIWVCFKCDTVNELSYRHCSNNTCGGTRYAKIKCIHCRTNNDGLSDICGKCYQQLR